MAINPNDIIDFDVMDTLGIPNIPGFSPSVTEALISFGGAWLINKLFGNYWGVFDQHGFPIMLVDSVVSIEYKSQNSVTSAPIEKGSFASYNKIKEPEEITVQLNKGSGGVTERALFMAQLKALSGSVNRFIIITPEAIYPNHSIESIDYARHADDGARLIKANLHLKEIRQVKSEYVENQTEDTSNSKDGGAQNPSTGGQKEAPPVENKSLWQKAVDTVSGWFS